jgi:hypothetical protein
MIYGIMVRLLLYSLGKFYQELIMLKTIALIKLFLYVFFI